RDYIIRVLEQTHWKVSGKNSAAQILGLNRSTLRARMRKLSIITPERVPFYSQ
nr:AAA family ATPase [Desulfobacter sp.]